MIVIEYEAPVTGGSSEADNIEVSAFVMENRTIELDVRNDQAGYDVTYHTSFGANGEDIVDAIKSAGIDIAHIRRFNEKEKPDDGLRGEPAWESLTPSGKPELIMHRRNGVLQNSIYGEPACITFDKDGNLIAAISVQNGAATELSGKALTVERNRQNDLSEEQRKRQNKYPLVIASDGQEASSSIDVLALLPMEVRSFICQVILEKNGVWHDGPNGEPSEMLLRDGQVCSHTYRPKGLVREVHTITENGVRSSSFYNKNGERSWGSNGEPAMKSVYPNGQTESINYMNNGQDCVGPDGKTISMGWYPDGTVRCATYKTENGTERLTYYPDGQCENSGRFTSNGYPAPGLHQNFHSNGVRASSIFIDENGKKHTHPNGDAAVMAWDEKGNVVKAIHYYHGVKLESENPRLPGLPKLPTPGPR